ncbi:proton-conducting transporter membrane subunit [Haliangium ochraceum]|uniref:NADH/Ubiquinone/plastoquinone (Complex I) n=1 Tax=Haliangium ochraceum (strain DSM 14365 / JCM 11303 / SMP-2) TaxID=502025 RepID=D0LNJ7_HALO1|nr:proton-conducting transporter membrane subunit [Haliangium ochraceum]ACY16902.1 NADH/Ubiquinone/plastoquinone (complex I) [Haliangium ochraceum DSM 14365]
MSTALACLSFLAPLVGGFLAYRAADARSARRAALSAAAVSVLAAAAFLLWTLFVERNVAPGRYLDVGFILPLPLFVSLIGFIAVAMNPAATGPKTFARIGMLSGVTSLMVLVRDPLILAALWTLEIGLGWRELRSRSESRPIARVYAFYLVPSALCAIVGCALLTMGRGEMAAIALLVAIAIRTAFFPAHTWLPAFVERAPMGIVVALVSPQVGVYVILRLLAGSGFGAYTELMLSLGVTTALFGGALGVVQRRARRALAYVLMSQTALVAFGLGLNSHEAQVATIGVWMAVGLATAGFAMVVAALQARRGPLHLDRPTGSYERVPLLATAFLLLGLTSVGLPGTFGFVAEELLFGATIGKYPWLTAALIGSTALNGVTVLRCFFYLFMGRAEHTGERDLVAREWIALTIFIGALIAEGLWPSPGIRWLESAEIDVTAPASAETAQLQRGPR